MKPLTPWGMTVKKKLIEKSMSVADLARAMGEEKHVNYFRDVMYGLRSGEKYKAKIERYLGLDA